MTVQEEHQGEPRLIVVEGNRRLAALKLLKRAFGGTTGVPPRFAALAAEYQ
jgi:hypothetical protein